MHYTSLINLRRAVFGPLAVMPVVADGTVTVTDGRRAATIPTAKAYQLLHLAGNDRGIRSADGTEAWKREVYATVRDLLDGIDSAGKVWR